MRCKYCFYADEISHRETPLHDVMDQDTQRLMIERIFDYADGPCTICFQGGEPTLAGLSYFRRFVEEAGRYNTKRLPVQYALQTNGLLVDEEWADFFAENHFLVGLSIDGPEEIHDRLRRDAKGEGTFKRVMKAARILEKHHVEYNVLTVVTAQTARHISKIYRYFMKNRLVYQQYMPCLDPLGTERGKLEFSLTPEAYLSCLKLLFDEWYRDRMNGEFVFIRDFENLAGILLGYQPERCGMSGHCVNQFVIESNGDVYPCDFYTLDPYCLGNLKESGFAELDAACETCGFVRESMKVETKCMDCEWYRICRGGCRRDRQGKELHEIGLNYFCETYRQFYSYAVPKMLELIRNIQN